MPRLNNRLALLSIEKDIIDSLGYSDVIEHFKRMKHRWFLLYCHLLSLNSVYCDSILVYNCFYFITFCIV